MVTTTSGKEQEETARMCAILARVINAEQLLTAEQCTMVNGVQDKYQLKHIILGFFEYIHNVKLTKSM